MNDIRKIFFAVLLFCSFHTPTFAVVSTWVGPSSSPFDQSWCINSNWDTNSVPENAGDTAILSTVATIVPPTLNGCTNFKITLGKLNLTVAGDWDLAGFITMDNNGSDAEINSTMGGNELSGIDFTLNDNLVVTVASGLLIESGNFTGSKTFTKKGSGTLTLGLPSSGNFYSGTMTIEDGTVNIEARGPETKGLAGSVIVESGNALNLRFGDNEVTVSLEDGASLGINFPQTVTSITSTGATGGTISKETSTLSPSSTLAANSIVLNSTSAESLSAPVDNTLVFDAPITGTGSFSNTGVGTITFEQPVTLSSADISLDMGTTQINSTFSVNSLSVTTGGTLGGSGTVTNDATILSGGILNGDGITIQDTLQVDSGGTLQGSVNVSDTSSEFLAAGDTINVNTGGTLQGDGAVKSDVAITGGTVTGSGLAITGMVDVNTGGTLQGTLTTTNGISVNTGGTLQGSGTIGSAVTMNGLSTGHFLAPHLYICLDA